MNQLHPISSEMAGDLPSNMWVYWQLNLPLHCFETADSVGISPSAVGDSFRIFFRENGSTAKLLTVTGINPSADHHHNHRIMVGIHSYWLSVVGCCGSLRHRSVSALRRRNRLSGRLRPVGNHWWRPGDSCGMDGYKAGDVIPRHGRHICSLAQIHNQSDARIMDISTQDSEILHLFKAEGRPQI